MATDLCNYPWFPSAGTGTRRQKEKKIGINPHIYLFYFTNTDKICMNVDKSTQKQIIPLRHHVAFYLHQSFLSVKVDSKASIDLLLTKSLFENPICGEKKGLKEISWSCFTDSRTYMLYSLALRRSSNVPCQQLREASGNCGRVKQSFFYTLTSSTGLPHFS